MDDKAERLHIIVVDDEPIGADDLTDMIREKFEGSHNVDVRTAYNASTVLKMVDDMPCDILISDIQMPGMSGLALAEELHKRFPGLCILFLTGYDDFNYAYAAFKQNAAHYLLKTEGDEAILSAIGEAINRLREIRQMTDRIHEAEKRYEQMMPAYRYQLLMQELMGVAQSMPSQDADELVSGSLYLVVARFEESPNAQQTRLKLIATSAVKEIITGALGESLRWAESFVLETELVWIFSMKDDTSYAHSLFQLARKARKRIEEQLSLTMFIVVADEGVSSDHVNEKYVEIRSMLMRETLQGAAGVAIRHADGVAPAFSQEQTQQMNHLRRELELCGRDVQDSAFENLRKHVGPLLDYLNTHNSGSDLFAMELTFSLTSQLLSYINKNGLSSVITDTEKYLQRGSVAYLEAMIEALNRNSRERIEYAVKSITRFIIEYIQDHLSEDISTSALAELSGYSTGYLSRVFKQEEGVSIHEFVTTTRMNLARELLCNTNLRVYEIASSCGYDNTTYFIKVFKNHIGLTPQEFKQDAAVRMKK